MSYKQKCKVVSLNLAHPVYSHRDCELIVHIPKPIKCLENEFRSHYIGTT